MTAFPSAPDPYRLGVVQPQHQIVTDEMTQVSPHSFIGAGTAVVVVQGQSNGANFANGTHTFLNASSLAMMGLHNGALYEMENLTIGCDGTLANMLVRAFDTLVEDAVYDRIVACFTGVAGTTFAQWVAGGLYNDRLLTAARRLASIGLTPTHFLMQQGESDGASGTSEALCLSRMQAIIQSVRDDGFAAPWFVARCSLGDDTVHANVQNAQDDVVNGTDIFAGADTDSLTGANRRDGTHFSDAGANAAAALWAAAIAAEA